MKHSTTTISAQHGHHGWSHSREKRVRHCLALAILMVLLLRIPVLQSQQPKVSEYQVKATYLYNFGRFVQWPAGVTATKGDSFSICVIGQDPFGAALDAILTDETIDGKAVVAKRVAKLQDTPNCRVLYISSSEDNRLKEILVGLDKAGVLTVSDIPRFSERGGMIQFVTAGNKVRFEVNLTNAQDAGLTLSSDLLKVAAAVRRSAQPGD